MPPIKLVLSDLDDTLLLRGQGFPEALAPVIRRLEASGIGFTFASGRPRETIDGYAAMLGIRLPIISCNGAVIYREGETLLRRTLRAGALRHLIQAADQMDMTVLYCLDDVEYCLRETDRVRKRVAERGVYRPVRPILANEWQTLALDKLNLIDDEGRIPQLASLEAEASAQAAITHYGCTGIEVVAPEVSKATGARFLAQALGLTMAEVLAIGDNENDDALLREAGIGAAVRNATEQTRRCADYVCEREGPDGVIEAIERFCFLGRDA